MRLLVLAVSALLLVNPAHAEDIVIKVVNNSSSVVEGLNTFTVGDDGVVVDDNVGGFFEPVGPGEVGEATLSLTKCQIVLAVVALKGDDELRSNINLCKEQTLVVND